MKGGGEERGQRDKKKTWITENVGRKDVTAWLVHGCHAATARSWGYGPGLEFRCCEADLRSLHKAHKWTHNMGVGCLPTRYISESTQFGDIRSFMYAANDFPPWIRTQQIYPKPGYSIMKREKGCNGLRNTGWLPPRSEDRHISNRQQFKIEQILNSWQGNPFWTLWTPKKKVISFFETSPQLPRDVCHIPGEQNFQYQYSHIRHTLTSQKWVSHFGTVRPIIRWWQLQQTCDEFLSAHCEGFKVVVVVVVVLSSLLLLLSSLLLFCCFCCCLQLCRIWRYVMQKFVTGLPEALCCHKMVTVTFQNF